MRLNNIITRKGLSGSCVVFVISLSLAISACNTFSAEENKSAENNAPKGQDTPGAGEEDKNAIELTQQQIKAVGIEIGAIEKKNLSSVIKASGQLEVPPQNKADVTALTGGVIKKIYVLEGSNVRKGQPVAMIENPEFIKLQQEYLLIKRGSTFTYQEFQRQKELKEAEAGTGKHYQQAESNLMVERARLKGLEAQMRQFGINPSSVSNGNIITQLPVRSPISGSVGHIRINVGSYVDAAYSLMEVIDNSQIHCDLQVFEKDLFKVKAGQEVDFILTNQDNRQITGRIYSINKSFETENKAVVVHAVINNGGSYKLIPGMYVSALIKTGSEQVTAVPVDAVVKSEGKEYIFMVEGQARPAKAEKEEAAENKEGKTGEAITAFKMIEVVTGISELGYVQITPVTAIPDKATVVTKGAFYILSKAKGAEEEEE